jgi:hypothetical protein
MSAPVWILSVDLQTRTASFETGLGNAARAARSAFAEIKQGGNEMGRTVGTNMFEARHGTMLLAEEFGVKLPRALTAFITSIGPIGAAMEAAFPFLAIAVGATLLLQHLGAMREAGMKLTQDQVQFGTAAFNAFNSLDDKLLEAGIKADELRNDHLGALKKQLELIDHQSMAELVHTFDDLTKAADTAFKDLKSSWYEFGSGSAGAQHALEQFKAQYESLLSQHRDKEASDLLKGTRESADRTLASIQRSVALAGAFTPPHIDGPAGAGTGAMAAIAAAYTAGLMKQLAAQQLIVGALKDQATAQQKVADIKKVDDGNAGRGAAGAMSSQASAAAREAAESQTRMGTAAVGADKSVAEARLTIARGSIEQRLALDTDFTNREYAVQMAGNAAQIAALDKLGKDYPNQLKALHDKALELTAQNANALAELTAKSSVAAAARDLQTLEQSEREKIEATQKGSQARLSAINAALKQEAALNLQDTSFYRELLNQRAEVTQQSLEEAAKLAESAGREEAENEQKMGELKLSAWKANQALQDSARHISDQQKAAEATTAANAEFALKAQAYAREAASLDKSGKDYANKLKELQDKEKQLVQEHENDVTAIKEKAEMERNARVLAANDQFNNQIARGLTQSIMGHQSWAKTLNTLGDQVVTGMIQNAIKSMLADDMTKERDAAAAARKAYNIGIGIGGPAGMILGPTFAAVTFAAQMAFAGGTDSVPGVGKGDSVPSLLTPGEGVVPGGVMDGLRGMARAGTLNGGGNTYHLHMTNHMNASALDGDGMTTVLEKHADQLHAHYQNAVRRMNK